MTRSRVRVLGVVWRFEVGSRLRPMTRESPARSLAAPLATFRVQEKNKILTNQPTVLFLSALGGNRSFFALTFLCDFLRPRVLARSSPSDEKLSHEPTTLAQKNARAGQGNSDVFWHRPGRNDRPTSCSFVDPSRWYKTQRNPHSPRVPAPRRRQGLQKPFSRRMADSWERRRSRRRRAGDR